MMPEEKLDPKRDVASEEIQFPYPFTGEPNSEIRVTRTAMVQGEVFVKSRIEGWVRAHGKPQPGTSVRIPDYQFDPILFQPSQ